MQPTQDGEVWDVKLQRAIHVTVMCAGCGDFLILNDVASLVPTIRVEAKPCVTCSGITDVANAQTGNISITLPEYPLKPR